MGQATEGDQASGSTARSDLGLGLGKRRKSGMGESFRRTRSFNLAASGQQDGAVEEEEEREAASGSGSDGDTARDPTSSTSNATSTRRMTVGGVGGIRSGKDLFDVRCLSDPSLLPAHHSLLNTLHRLTQSTQPTVFHKYMKTLDDEGRLLRVYTQNIDGLEAKVGLDLRAPGDVVEGMRIERRWKRERSRRELQLGQETTIATAVVGSKEAIPQPPPRLVKDVRPTDFALDQPCEPGSSRQSTPSRLSTTDEGGDSVSEAERTLLECDQRSRSDTPQYASTAAGEENTPDTPASSRSVSSVRTDLSAQYGFLRTPTKMEPLPDVSIRAHVLPRAVPLHGVLSTMDCTRCSYSQNFEEYYPLPADLLSCPSCEETQEERLAANQRARSVGVLRASVLLYNEPCKHDTAIGEIVEKDVLGVRKDDRPDLLIVAGTTLKIPGVIKIVKQLSNALRMNYPDEKTRARNRQRAANRKRKRKMRDEGLLPPEASGGEETETETEDEDDEPFSVDNFPIRTILLNRDAPGKAWEDTFDVWVQGDLQDFMHSWVTHGPTPTEVEGTMEWMWKKGARERNRLAKAKLSGAFNSPRPESSSDADLGLQAEGSSSRKKKINLSNRSKAERWMEAQSYGWERPTYFSQLATVSKAEGTELGIDRRESACSHPGPEKIEEESEAITDKEVPVEASLPLVEQIETGAVEVSQKKPRKSKKAKAGAIAELELPVESVGLAQNPPKPSTKKRTSKAKKEIAPVVIGDSSIEVTTVKPKRKSTARKNPALPFPASKPGSAATGEISKTSDKAKSTQVEAPTRIVEPTLVWNRLVEGSLSPPPLSDCEAAEAVKLPTKSIRTGAVQHLKIDLRPSTDSSRSTELDSENRATAAVEDGPEGDGESVRRSTRIRIPKRLSIA